ncbi:hypothetical protein OJAG_23550 [Oerskovia enterophila]|uniref:DUF6318 domain-containing protein n=1 Tax=Oerskovia enterophila TaxID=43678 RepID=A0A163R9J5_9CELL|nr:hypothetical protein OJAG_23550 [Oerskovia enterophila]
MGSQGLHRAAAHARRGVSGAGRRHERGDWGRSWSLGAVALVVGIGVVLGGCSTPAPEVEKTPSVVSEAPSPTSTPTPVPTGPVKPERPADMDRTDEVGAAAAATYFLELYPYVMATGDLEEWDAMTWAETCEFCTTVRDESLVTKQNGYIYSGANLELSSVVVGALDTLIGGYPVTADYVQSPHRSETVAGDVISEDDGSSGQLQIDTISTDEGWKILALVVAG